MSVQTFPVWYHPDAPLGSAVRYTASLSGSFRWVGIQMKNGTKWSSGPSLGAGPKGADADFRQQAKSLLTALLVKNEVSLRKHFGFEKSSELGKFSGWFPIESSSKKIVGYFIIFGESMALPNSETQKEIKVLAEELGRLWPRKSRKKN